MSVKEIYIRNPEDPNYQYNVFSHSDPIESIISKVKMILGTTQGQILGDINFGVGIEDLIFETKINKVELEEKILKQIQQYVSESSQFKIQPSVSFGKADGFNYAIIDIFINDQKSIGILIK
jgi:hypothetical protein